MSEHDQKTLTTAQQTRLVRIAIAVILVGLAVLLLVRTQSVEDAYRVRAIFDNAFALIPGEDVKISGVKVGTVESMEVTKDKKAAVVLKITEPGFDDFRSDAHCTIRPQSLIGEKFVECTPTRPRMAGASLPPELKPIPSGEPNAGQRLLPVTHTTSPVDLDLVGNILREPERQRLTLIINELGTGLAGRGEELKAVIRRANPALEETDKVLAILAQQNRALASLATDSDAVLGQLADHRTQVGDFIDKSGQVAQATAQRRVALAQDLEKLPEFLRQLRPTVRDLGDLAGEANPVIANTRPVAKDVSDFTVGLKAFSEEGTPAIETLGEAAEKGTPAVKAAQPVVQQLKTVSENLPAVASGLAELTQSLKDTGGVKQLLLTFFNLAGSTNGYDQLGHFQRVLLLANLCVTYAVTPTAGCSANFIKADASAKSAKVQKASMANLIRNAKALRDVDPVNSKKTAADTGGSPGDAAALDYLLGGDK